MVSNHIVIASTKYVTVLFILNESKTVTIWWYTQYPSYCYATFDYSGYDTIPANTTICIESAYPFEITLYGKTYYSIYNPVSYEYVINNVTFLNDTTIYINFLPKPPPQPKEPLLIVPPHSNTETIATHSLTSTSYINETDIAMFFIFIVLVMAFVIILATKKK